MMVIVENMNCQNPFLSFATYDYLHEIQTSLCFKLCTHHFSLHFLLKETSNILFVLLALQVVPCFFLIIILRSSIMLAFVPYSSIILLFLLKNGALSSWEELGRFQKDVLHPSLAYN